MQKILPMRQFYDACEGIARVYSLNFKKKSEKITSRKRFYRNQFNRSMYIILKEQI